MISEKFKQFVEEYIYDSAEEHCRIHKDRYYGKTKKQLEEDLYINHDFSGEEEFIKDTYGKYTQEEYDYYYEKFNQEVLKFLGHGDTQ
jgi:hypothetical protein